VPFVTAHPRVTRRVGVHRDWPASTPGAGCAVSHGQRGLSGATEKSGAAGTGVTGPVVPDSLGRA
jgi:hypothetical protein